MKNNLKDKNKGFITVGTAAGIALIVGLIIAAVVSEDDIFGLTGPLGEAGVEFFKALIIGISTIVVAVGQSLATLAGKLLEYTATSSFLTKPITNHPSLLIGWAQIRDLSNMFIVLGFVVIGIATTLRLREYEAKKLLLPLILVALLINFSNVFVGVIIDGSNKLTEHFLKAGSNIGTNIVGQFDKAYSLPPDQGGIDWDNLRTNTDKDPNAYVAAMVTFAVGYILLAVVLFYLTITLIARQALFGIFFIFAPLAFLCWTFPQTKKIWTMWWENFIKWAFIGAQIAFFLWLAAKMISPKVVPGSEQGTIDFLVVIILLFLAVKVAKKSSAIGAGAVMGLAGGALGFALGASKAVGMAGLKQLGKSEGAQQIKGGVGRTLERMGLRQEGVTGMKEGARITEEQKRYEAMFKSGNASDKARAMETAKTGRGRNRAGAYAAAAATGNLNDTYRRADGTVDTEAMNRGLIHTEQFGAGENLRKQTLKENPMVAALDDKKVDENITKLGYANRLQAGTTGLAKAKAMAVTDAVQKTAPGDATKWTPDILTPEVAASLNRNQAIEIAKRGSPALVEKLKKYKRAIDPATGRAIRGISDPRQSTEFKALADHVDKNFGGLGSGSVEEKRAIALLDEMETNNVFK